MKSLEKEILKVLNENFLVSPKYIQNNIHVFEGWESDYFAVTKDFYAYEIEVKTSRQDFQNDFAKTEKHALFYGLKTKYISAKDSHVGPVSLVPNYFYYACIEGLLSKDDMPEYAGLIHVTLSPASIKVIKKSPLLSPLKFNPVYYKLDEKFYGRLVNIQRQVREMGTDLAIREQAAGAAAAVRDSAVRAFWYTCPFHSGEEDFPMCNKGRKGEDCLLQCELGRLFKSKLK